MYKTATPLGRRVPKTEPPPTIEDARFSLCQNYPNPFNGRTTIQYDVSLFAKVDIRIYSVLGEEIATLASLERPAGKYSVDWAPRRRASGLYFCVMKTTSSLGTSHNTIKILYLR